MIFGYNMPYFYFSKGDGALKAGGRVEIAQIQWEYILSKATSETLTLDDF